MLSYRCTNACRHCLYWCSPTQPADWLKLEAAERIFDVLASEPRLTELHLAGGEPSMNLDLLVDIVRLAGKKGMPLGYVETNASWCKDRDVTHEGLARLREAGLPAILVSVSMFHNEFVPFSHTRNCVEAAGEVFGRGGVLLYLPHMYRMLSQMPDEGTHTLQEFCRWAGIDPDSADVPRSYQVIPAGRAVRALRSCYKPAPAQAFRGDSCEGELLSTSHFHIDNYGNLFTGLCAGIVAADMTDLHPQITPETHPVFTTLCESGSYGLMEKAIADSGFKPCEDGYVSKCDLCYDVRCHLQKETGSPELRPASFYSV